MIVHLKTNNLNHEYLKSVLPQFLKTLFQSQFLFDFDEIFTNRTSEARTYVIFCDYF